MGERHSIFSMDEINLTNGKIVPDHGGECRWWKVYDASGKYLRYKLSLKEALDELRPLTEEDEAILATYSLTTI